MLKRFNKRLVVITWVALLLACVTTADLVFDLVFEAEELSHTIGGAPEQEEPDNSAEHIMLPALKADFTDGALLLSVWSHAVTTLCPVTSPPTPLSGSEPPHLIKSIKPPSPSSIQVLRI